MTYLIHARWLLLLLFPVGYLLTQGEFADDWIFYLALNMLSFLSGWAILFRLRGITAGNILIWFIFAVLIIGYYVKYYFLVHGFHSGKSIFELGLLLGNFAPRVASNNILLECFKTISASFAAFAIVAFYLLPEKRDLRPGVGTMRTIMAPRGSALSLKILGSAMLLMVITGYLRWFYHLGIPGAAKSLPYNIAGMITVTSDYTVPVLIGIALIYAVKTGVIQVVRLTMVAFLIWGLVHFLLFTSKTFLIVPILWIFLVGVIIRRPLIKWRYIFGYGGLLVLVYPYLNFFRHLSYIGAEGDIINRFGEAIRMGSEQSALSGHMSSLVWGIYGLASRVTGLDSLIIMAAIRREYHHYGILNYMLGNEESAERIMTWYHGIEGTGVGQSFLGQAYYVTGNNLWMAAWVAGWTVFTFWVAKSLRKYDAPLTQGLWAAWLISVLRWTIDGVSFLKIMMFGVSAVPVILLVLFFDLGSTERRRSPVHGIAQDSDVRSIHAARFRSWRTSMRR